MNEVLSTIENAREKIIGFNDFLSGDVDTFFKVSLRGGEYIVCADNREDAVDHLVDMIDAEYSPELFLTDKQVDSGNYHEEDYTLCTGTYGETLYHKGDLHVQELTPDNSAEILEILTAIDIGADKIIDFEDYLMGGVGGVYTVTANTNSVYVFANHAQDAVDRVIDNYTNKGESGVFLTQEQLSSGDYFEDEYLTGGNEGQALYHGGNFIIENI